MGRLCRYSMASSPEDRGANAIEKVLDYKTLNVEGLVSCLVMKNNAIQTAFFELLITYVHTMAALYDQGLLSHSDAQTRIGAQCKEWVSK